MILRELLADYKGPVSLSDDSLWDIDVAGVSPDSRSIGKGDVFVAARGEYHDGHMFIPQALSKGAAAVIVDNKEFCRAKEPWILVGDSREACAMMEQIQAGRPSERMGVIGITGTNGKTTVSNMIAAILEEAGKKIGLIGTIHNRIGEQTLKTDLTTPGSGQLAALLGRMADEEVDYAIMEVSSHALDQRRIAGIEFDLAVFTNLSQDHLDYHGTMDEYFKAKSKLFTGLKAKGKKRRVKAAIINTDDKAGAAIADFCEVSVISYGLGAGRSLRATDIELSPEGIRYKLHIGQRVCDIKMRLHGRFNVYNSLAAIGAALTEKIDIDTIIVALEKMEPVPGRFQRVSPPETDGTEDIDFQVYIDYSHTPDSLEKCVSAAKEMRAGKVICVFGAGGHRDATKRPLMGEVGSRLSDIAIVTSDNPRDEEPMDIINDILSGVKSPSSKEKVMVEPDRSKAITLAINLARTGDIVLICGKGHEDYQIIGDTKYPFDDYKHAREAMRALRGSI